MLETASEKRCRVQLQILLLEASLMVLRCAKSRFSGEFGGGIARFGRVPGCS